MVFPNYFTRHIACIALAAICLITAGKPVFAAPTVGPGCDPAFMSAMQDKAWMEAQREIMIAESTIAKPDSVFALSCFGQLAKNTGTGGFSGGTSSTMTDNVTSFVKAAFSSYGGGHLTGFDNNSDSLTNCGLMAQIWNAARCTNADRSSPQFGTLQDISSYNRGTYPVACTAQGATTTAWTTGQNTIYGVKDDSGKRAHSAGKSVGAAFDDMNLFTDKTAAVSLTSGKTCADGIPTGIKMGDVAEVVCPNPGCYPSAGKCEHK